MPVKNRFKWKVLCLWSPTRGDIATVSADEKHPTASVVVPVGELEGGDVYLEFRKPKILGVLTGVYRLLRTDRLIGNDVTFTWATD